MTTTTNVQQLKINKMTSAQYATITPSDTELYYLTDGVAITSSDIATALGYTPTKTITAANTALTQSGGVCTWTISQDIGTGVQVKLYLILTGEEVLPDSVTITATTAVIKILSTSNISANTYRAVITG